MRKNRKWSALKLKKQYVYSKQDEYCKPIRKRSIFTVTYYLDRWEHPCRYKRRWWGYSCWKRQRKTQYK